MFLQDKLPNNKDINYLERNESSHPLLQIIYRNKFKNKENIISPKTPKTSTISASTNLLNKNSNNNTINITPQLDLTKTLNLFNNKKSINSPIYSDASHNSNNNKLNNSHEENKKKFRRNLFGKRKTVNPTKKKIKKMIYFIIILILIIIQFMYLNLEREIIFFKDLKEIKYYAKRSLN